MNRAALAAEDFGIEEMPKLVAYEIRLTPSEANSRV